MFFEVLFSEFEFTFVEFVLEEEENGFGEEGFAVNDESPGLIIDVAVKVFFDKRDDFVDDLSSDV